MEVPSKDFADGLTCIEYRKSGLSKTLKRHIKETEEYLGRTCRKIWAGRSRTGNVYLYSNFCVNYDKVIITLAYYAPGVGWISCL